PFLGGPRLNKKIIPLTCTLNLLLDTPANRVHQSTNMIYMIAHAKIALDDARNACLSPHIADKAVGFSARLEQIGKPRTLLLSQIRRRAWMGAISQRDSAARSSTSNPLADCALSHAQRDGDLFLRPALLIQVPGTKAASFAPVRWLWYDFHDWHDTTPL